MMISAQPLAPAFNKPALSSVIHSHLHEMRALDLDQLASVALLNRTDTKFLMTQTQMAFVLARAANDYRVLEVGGARASWYHTQYFDTRNLGMYRAHHNGLRDRYKVRLRSYVDSGVTFLEVKLKTNLERTIKRRLPLGASSGAFTDEERAFLRMHTPYDPECLVPTVANDFLRVTLVSADVAHMERLTLDFSLNLHGMGRTLALPGIVIAEVKQPKFSTRSPFVQLTRAQGVEPRSFSKYCMAIALLYPDVKRNLFKVRIRDLERLLAQENA